MTDVNRLHFSAYMRISLDMSISDVNKTKLLRPRPRPK